MNNIDKIKQELLDAGASEKEADELAYFSKNISNTLGFERSENVKKVFLESAKNKNNYSYRSFMFLHKSIFASILGMFLLLGFATVVSAQDSVPGEPLYKVKRATENVVSFVNPSFNSEILKRRSREIKHLANPENSSKKTEELKTVIKDYENELEEHKDIDKAAIEESRANLEEARDGSDDEDRLEIENVIRRIQSKEEDDSSRVLENREINREDNEDKENLSNN
jgi:hypothetical protein